MKKSSIFCKTLLTAAVASICFLAVKAIKTIQSLLLAEKKEAELAMLSLNFSELKKR